MSGFSSLAEMQAIILGRHIWGISKFLRFINELAEEREMVSEMSHCCRLGGLGKDCGFENWNRDDFKALLKLVKSFVLLIRETRKKELYGDQDCVVSGCSCSCPLTGGLTSSACVCGYVVNGVSATAAT